MLVESTRFSVCSRGISGLRSVFIFLRLFKLAHIYIQVCTLHNGVSKESSSVFLIENRFRVKLRILSPEIGKQGLRVGG